MYQIYQITQLDVNPSAASAPLWHCSPDQIQRSKRVLLDVKSVKLVQTSHSETRTCPQPNVTERLPDVGRSNGWGRGVGDGRALSRSAHGWVLHSGSGGKSRYSTQRFVSFGFRCGEPRGCRGWHDDFQTVGYFFHIKVTVGVGLRRTSFGKHWLTVFGCWMCISSADIDRGNTSVLNAPAYSIH